MANALTYKRLAYLAYEARQGLSKPAAARFARRFNPVQFAALVEGFCDGRPSRGGGGWPAAWSRVCQASRIDAKTRELESWRQCRQERQGTCRSPTQDFDKSGTDGGG